MTEADAVTRFCPLARSMIQSKNAEGVVVASTAVNQHRGDGLSIMTCLGSQCMLWRWTGKREPVGEELVKRRFGPIRWMARATAPAGKCGLA
jgi:hypothetical protein